MVEYRTPRCAIQLTADSRDIKGYEAYARTSQACKQQLPFCVVSSSPSVGSRADLGGHRSWPRGSARTRFVVFNRACHRSPQKSIAFGVGECCAPLSTSSRSRSIRLSNARQCTVTSAD